MSLSNKELLDKTLFLKDSVLFISMDGKEYEVSNPEEFTGGLPIEWTGGVEMIKQFRPKGGIVWHKFSGLTKSKESGYEFRTVARLLPNEKKIYNQALSGYKPESDYKQFEPWSKEQFNSPQNQNRDNAIVGFLKTGLDKIDELGVNLSNDDKAKLLNRRIENLSKQVESSEPQEKEPDSFLWIS